MFRGIPNFGIRQSFEEPLIHRSWSNQELGARVLISLILADRTDFSEMMQWNLDCCAIFQASYQSYSRALPFIWLHLKDEEHLTSRLCRLVWNIFCIANSGQKITDSECPYRIQLRRVQQNRLSEPAPGFQHFVLRCLVPGKMPEPSHHFVEKSVVCNKCVPRVLLSRAAFLG